MVKGRLISLYTVFLIFAGLLLSLNCNAQLANPQLALGSGVGISTAYAGADVPKENSAFYIDLSYYPLKYGNIGFLRLQVQDGTFVGDAEPDHADGNFKAFTSQYQSVTFSAQLYAGAFFKSGDDALSNFLRNFYAGIGLGVTAGAITNVNTSNPIVEGHTSNVLPTAAGTGGFEVSLLKTSFGEPILKLNFSTGFYWVVTRGLDGYYVPFGSATNFYTSYSVGLKYVVVLRKSRVRGYNRLQ
jgi:hypothetical protein